MMRFCPAFHTVQLMKQVRIGFIVTFSNQEKIAIGFLEQRNPLIIIIIFTNTTLPLTSRHVLLHKTDISDIYSKLR